MLSSVDDCSSLTKEQQIELAWDLHYYRIPRTQLLSELRAQLIDEQDNKCHYCSVEMTVQDSERQRATDATLDHKLARCFGGQDTLDNLVASCSECNNNKGHTDYDEFIKQKGKR